MFSVAPELIDAIVAAAQDALPYVTVSDGFAASSSAADTLMIGVDDPNVDGAQYGVDSEHDFVNGNLDGMIEEKGTIVCAAMSWVGDLNGAKTVRDRVYAIANSVAELCRIRGGTDPAFGVERAMWTVCGKGGTQLLQWPGDRGVAALLIFRIYYEGRP